MTQEVTDSLTLLLMYSCQTARPPEGNGAAPRSPGRPAHMDSEVELVATSVTESLIASDRFPRPPKPCIVQANLGHPSH